MIKFNRSANARSVVAGRTTITLWRRWRSAGWSHELMPWGEGRGWTYDVSWGRPAIHSRLAFHISIEHRNKEQP